MYHHVLYHSRIIFRLGFHMFKAWHGSRRIRRLHNQSRFQVQYMCMIAPVSGPPAHYETPYNISLEVGDFIYQLQTINLLLNVITGVEMPHGRRSCRKPCQSTTL